MTDTEFDSPMDTSLEPDTFAPVAQQRDFFAKPDAVQVTLSDGVSFITIEELREGDRRKYQDESAKGVVQNNRTNMTHLNYKPGTQRHRLLADSIIGWNIVRDGSPLPFSDRNLKEFLEHAPSSEVDLVMAKVEEVNPWLDSELTVESIDEEIERLESKRDEILERQGKGSNS